MLNRYSEMALRYAEKSDCKCSQHGCVISMNNKIISIGYNFYADAHKVLGIQYTYTRHAEIDALLKLPPGINYGKIILIVVRSEARLSKPCDKCISCMQQLGIKKVYYSDSGKLVRL